MPGYIIPNADEISAFSKQYPDWCQEENCLAASFKLASFKIAIKFINLVAEEAERINHHPTIFNAFKLVEFKLSTHDAGNKITDLDFKLAAFISKAAREFIPQQV